jgi:hypothetical protein
VLDLEPEVAADAAAEAEVALRGCALAPVAVAFGAAA